jgi:hypothetical protein
MKITDFEAHVIDESRIDLRYVLLGSVEAEASLSFDPMAFILDGKCLAGLPDITIKFGNVESQHCGNTALVRQVFNTVLDDFDSRVDSLVELIK